MSYRTLARFCGSIHAQRADLRTAAGRLSGETLLTSPPRIAALEADHRIACCINRQVTDQSRTREVASVAAHQKAKSKMWSPAIDRQANQEAEDFFGSFGRPPPPMPGENTQTNATPVRRRPAVGGTRGGAQPEHTRRQGGSARPRRKRRRSSMPQPTRPHCLSDNPEATSAAPTHRSRQIVGPALDEPDPEIGGAAGGGATHAVAPARIRRGFGLGRRGDAAG